MKRICRRSSHRNGGFGGVLSLTVGSRDEASTNFGILLKRHENAFLGRAHKAILWRRKTRLILPHTVVAIVAFIMNNLFTSMY